MNARQMADKHTVTVFFSTASPSSPPVEPWCRERHAGGAYASVWRTLSTSYNVRVIAAIVVGTRCFGTVERCGGGPEEEGRANSRTVVRNMKMPPPPFMLLLLLLVLWWNYRYRHQQTLRSTCIVGATNEQVLTTFKTCRARDGDEKRFCFVRKTQAPSDWHSDFEP